MVDMDMFTRKGMNENIFTETGIGMIAQYQEHLFRGICRRHPTLTNPKYPYWGGAIYRVDKDARKRLRDCIDRKEIVDMHNRGFDDELIMHRIATRAKMEKNKLLGEYRWCHCSYRDGIENASMIHIRTKITPKGPKRTKMENYKDLIKKGLIEK